MLRDMRYHAVCIVITAITLVIAAPARSQEWFSFDGATVFATEPGIEVRESNISHVGFDVAVYGMNVSDTLYEANTYHILNIPGYAHTNKVGAPKLPAIRVLVAIPECEGVLLNIAEKDSILFQGFLVYPVPKRIVRETPEGFTYPDLEFAKDDSIYSLDSFYPDNFGRIIRLGYIRNQKVAHVEVNPLRFNPITEEIVAYPHFEIKLDFDSPRGPLIQNVGPFTSICRSTIINYR